MVLDFVVSHVMGGLCSSEHKQNVASEAFRPKINILLKKLILVKALNQY